MKTLIAALILVSTQAQAGLINIYGCQSNQKGFDVGASLRLQYDTDEKAMRLTVSNKTISGTHTISEKAVALPHPMVVGAPESYESASLKLTVFPMSSKGDGKIAARLLYKGRRGGLTDFTCARLR